MKAILAIDMPENCWECPCYDGYWQCGATGNSFEIQDEIHNRRPDWCPLKPIPNKRILPKSEVDGTNYGEEPWFSDGWNACIDEIGGKREKNER